MSTEEKNIRQILENMAKGKDSGEKLTYDRDTKSIRTNPSYHEENNAGTINLTAEDFRFAAEDVDSSGHIVITEDVIKNLTDPAEIKPVHFMCWDKGDVYSMIGVDKSQCNIHGTVRFLKEGSQESEFDIGNADDRVRIFVRHRKNRKSLPGKSTEVRGYVLENGNWIETPVEVVPVEDEIFSRNIGLIETKAISSKNVAFFAAGSVGSEICSALAKAGVDDFSIMDNDRLKVCNISRHIARLPHVGRRKPNAMAQIVRETSPYSRVTTSEKKICWENIEEVRQIINKAHIVICTTDNRVSRLIINRECVAAGKTCIYAGLFRRAYGGQVFRVYPRISPCYQCFCMLLPEQDDQEISNPEQARRLGYSDRPVAVEPGLANDISPISNMVTKLAIQELVKGTVTTLRSLDDDLVAPWYLWLNRRMEGTQYEDLEPLEFNVGGMHILRWYGIDAKCQPDCPVCGDFEGHLAKCAGV